MKEGEEEGERGEVLRREGYIDRRVVGRRCTEFGKRERARWANGRE